MVGAKPPPGVAAKRPILAQRGTAQAATPSGCPPRATGSDSIPFFWYLVFLGCKYRFMVSIFYENISSIFCIVEMFGLLIIEFSKLQPALSISGLVQTEFVSMKASCATDIGTVMMEAMSPTAVSLSKNNFQRSTDYHFLSSPASVVTQRPSCPFGYFQCSDDRCIPESALCNGSSECYDGGDEFDCEQYGKFQR